MNSPSFAKRCRMVSTADTQKLYREASDVELPIVDVVGNDFSEWLHILAGAHNTRVEFLLMGLISTTSALLGWETRVQVRPTYLEPLNIFLVCLAHPGAGKSQAHRLACLEGIPEISRHILVDDFTRKGLLAHLEKEGTGLLAYEEMGAFFETIFKRQSEGTAERAHFCRLYDGGVLKASYADNQGKLKTTTVEHPHVTIGGFQTPDTFIEQYCQLLTSSDGFVDSLPAQNHAFCEWQRLTNTLKNLNCTSLNCRISVTFICILLGVKKSQ